MRLRLAYLHLTSRPFHKVECQGHAQVECQGHTQVECQFHTQVECQGHTQVECQDHTQVECQGHSQVRLRISLTLKLVAFRRMSSLVRAAFHCFN